MSIFDVSNVYTPTTYEEMKEASRQAKESAKNYKQAYKNFLITCLCEAGFAKKKVRHKKLNIVGVLEVIETNYYAPYEIKFYPVKKDGGISLKSKYHGFYHEDRLVEELTANFELAGDENAG